MKSRMHNPMAQRRVHIALLDIRLPSSDIYLTTKHLVERLLVGGAKVGLITAYIRREDEELARELNVPIFWKGDISDFSYVAKEIESWGSRSMGERMR